MGLGGAMNSGVSGLQAFSNAMSVIGNNLANTNTAGFKASRTLFSDLMPDTVTGSGGTSQIGRGANLSVVDDVFKQGSIESSSSNLDLAIEGSGFFMVRNPENQTNNFTRAGTFRLDEQGYLTNPEGYIVQGYASQEEGGFEDLTSDIRINTRSFVPGRASDEVDLTTNLDAQETAQTWDVQNPTTSSNFATTSEVYDSLGNTHLITTYFTKTGSNNWEYHQTVPAADINNASDNPTDGLATLSGDPVSAPSADPPDLFVNGNQLGSVDTTTGNLAQAWADAIAAAGSTGDTNVTTTVNSASTGQLGNFAATSDSGNDDSYTLELQVNGTTTTILDQTGGVDGGAVDADSVDAALASLDADGDGVLDGTSNIEYSGTAAAGNLTFMTADGSDLTITETLGGDATGGFTGTLAGSSQTTYGSLDVACNADLELTGADAANAGFTGTTSATYDPTMVEVNNGSFSFNPQGQLAEITRSDGTTVSPEDSTWPNVHISAGNLDWNNGADATQDVTYEMNITQFATDSKVVTQQANGYTSGYLTDLAVDKEGTITATYSNGETRDMARLALGKFSNNNGLEKLGKNLYQATNDSGPADVGMPGSGVGKIFSNSLEQSTVDIAEEFTKMITTQRSFQANSRTITTTDEMLNEVINMKR